MRDLLELRDEIDQIDSQIVDLYERRMAISEEVAEYKIAVGKKVFDKQREVSKLETLSRKGTTPFLKHGIRELFEQIMSMSRKRQYQLLTEHGQTNIRWRCAKSSQPTKRMSFLYKMSESNGYL